MIPGKNTEYASIANKVHHITAELGKQSDVIRLLESRIKKLENLFKNLVDDDK